MAGAAERLPSGRDAAGDARRSASGATLRGPRLQAFVNTGGVSARRARPSAGAALVEFAPSDALGVSDDALSALFGPARAELLRVEGLPLQVERQKEWKNRKR